MFSFGFVLFLFSETLIVRWKDTKLKELALKTCVETSNLGSKIWDGDRKKILCVVLMKGLVLFQVHYASVEYR